MNLIVFNVNDEYEGLRIDRYISEQSVDMSRSYIQKLIKDNCLTVNDRPVRSSYQVKADDIVRFEVPDNQTPEILPENIELDIIYEDPDIIVVNKPRGMVVHPAAGHFSNTLVNALMYHCRDLSGINGVLRPGIVHRIDKDTSGILVCAKSDFAHKGLSDQLKDHSMTRKYEAVCAGIIKDITGTVEGPIGRNPNNRKTMDINYKNGKPAVTHYAVLTQYQKYAHIQCILDTGRTHQIRVHMTSIGHPLLGDTVYGGKLSEYKLNGKKVEGQTLHARVLGFVHPVTGEYMEFESELPDYFKEILKSLN